MNEIGTHMFRGTVSNLHDWLVDQLINRWHVNGNGSSFMDPSCNLEFFYSSAKRDTVLFNHFILTNNAYLGQHFTSRYVYGFLI